jgi:hypothetical protein
MQWDQSWVKDEVSLAGLVVQRVYVSPVFQVKEYKVEQAGELFAQAVSGPMFRNFGEGGSKGQGEEIDC